MPFIHVKLSRTPSPAQRQSLVAGLTALMVDPMGKRREVTVVNIDPQPHAAWAVGGQAADEKAMMLACVDIKITAGMNTAPQKERLIGGVWDLLQATFADVAPPTYIVVHELAADAWGYGGRTQARRLQSRAGEEAADAT